MFFLLVDSISGKVFKTALVSRWLSTIEGGASAGSEINCQNREEDSPQIEQRAENEAFTLDECCTSQHVNEILSVVVILLLFRKLV